MFDIFEKYILVFITCFNLDCFFMREPPYFTHQHLVFYFG